MPKRTRSTGFYQVVLESFAEKVKTLLAFAKLRADVTEALELRTANEVLAAVGDQTSHIVHRLNNTVGAMRVRIVELQKRNAAGTLKGSGYLDGVPRFAAGSGGAHAAHAQRNDRDAQPGEQQC